MLTRKNFVFVIFLAVLVLSGVGIIPRYTNEMNNKTVAFVVEHKDFVSMSQEKSVSFTEFWKMIKEAGIEGLTVSEFTGDELSDYAPEYLKFVTASAAGVSGEGILPANGTLLCSNSYKYKPELALYLSAKIPGLKTVDTGAATAFVFPDSKDSFKVDSIIPDFSALEFCRENGIKVIFRPGQNHIVSGEKFAAALAQIFDSNENVKILLPTGAVMPGYPRLSPVVKLLKEKKVDFAQVEFVKQIGVSNFMFDMKNGIIPLHSLTKEETISKKISQRQVIERYVRAIHERSIRVALLRPYDLYTGDRADTFISDVAKLRGEIEKRGYKIGWPVALPSWPSPFAGAVAVALAFVISLFSYVTRYFAIDDKKLTFAEAVAILVAAGILSVLLVKVHFAAKLFGGFTGALVAVTAALYALEAHNRKFAGAVSALFIIIAGGLSIASFYGNSAAALRLTPFSGVKLTLLLPPVFLVLHDFKLRIHPETLSEIFERPALWFELFLIGVAMLAMAVMALRSGNVSSVPDAEIAFREFMERAMSLRPRTKEFVIGYPMLVLYWYLVKNGLFAKYREIVRLAAILAFCSAVNTFCHFHTEILLSVLRVFNGWWLGLLLGTIGVIFLRFILTPVFAKLREFDLIG